MREDPVILSQKEQQRLRVITEVEAGRMEPGLAAGLLGLSLRQVRRLRHGYRKEGARAFMHGNRGRRAAHRIPDEVRETVTDLLRTKYAGCNDTHFTELLALREGVVLGRKSVERLRQAAGLKPVQRRRAPRHRSRRERMPQEGMLLQVDGSPFNWFGEDQPRFTLLGAIDDATGKVVAALFREQEDAQGYFLLLRQVLKGSGIPLDIYRDRHGIFQNNLKTPWTLEEELAGRREPTQLGRALEELGIISIAAQSPQAKGRVERLWRTFQDRLTVELRLAGIKDIRAANRFLPGFLKRFNARFAVPASEPGLAYRTLDAALDLDRVLSFRYQRTVALNNTVRLEERLIQIPPGPKRRSYAGCRVWVHELLDGSLAVWYQDRWIARTSSRGDGAVIRARKRKPAQPADADPVAIRLPLESPTPRPQKPKAQHPWRRWQSLGAPKIATTRTESLSS
jgi:transposase